LNLVSQVSIDNGKVGKKALWVLALGIHAVFCFIDGYHLLIQEFAYGSGILVGWMYLITGFVQVVAMFLLVLAREEQLLIEQGNLVYRANFYLPRKSNKIRADLYKALHLKNNEKGKDKTAKNDETATQAESNISSEKNARLHSLIPALVLWSIGALSITINMFAGTITTVALLITGMLAFIDYWKIDCSLYERRGTICSPKTNGKKT